ncbi:hypothetical protein R50073_22790 [Maricurvus nonylphenolicus]|uniref:cell division inhibitor SulA n=1 Tax=Maricurvus nonylphenolicus TaxID=1008307 RepID=UPI0036F3EE1C
MALAQQALASPASYAGAARSKPQQHGVTELVLPVEQLSDMAMVLPMIAHLSQRDHSRWMTWIAPRGINRALLEAYGVDTQRLRIIHTQGETDCWMIWEALSSGTSHTVIASPGVITEKAIAQLDAAAKSGKCDGLLLRFR